MPGRTQPVSEVERLWDGEYLLHSHDISKNGFLPDQEPLRRLPSPYYAPWELVLDDLPSLIKKRLIQIVLDRIPVLSTSKLHTEAEWRRAYVILSFFTHAYIWGGEMASEVRTISSLTDSVANKQTGTLTIDISTLSSRIRASRSSASCNVCCTQLVEFRMQRIRPART